MPPRKTNQPVKLPRLRELPPTSREAFCPYCRAIVKIKQTRNDYRMWCQTCRQRID